MATETELAYIAGLLDGEGCIYIEKRHPSLKMRTINPQYFLGITITNADLIVLRWLQDLLGGKVKLQNPKKIKEGYKPTWKWYKASKKAYEFLLLVLPYLRTKRREAEEAITFQEFLQRLPKNKAKAQCELRVLEEAHQILRAYKREGRTNVN